MVHKKDERYIEKSTQEVHKFNGFGRYGVDMSQLSVVHKISKVSRMVPQEGRRSRRYPVRSSMCHYHREQRRQSLHAIVKIPTTNRFLDDRDRMREALLWGLLGIFWDSYRTSEQPALQAFFVLSTVRQF